MRAKMPEKLKLIAVATATLAPVWLSACDVGTSAAIRGPKVAPSA
jgi:hypothetical protein